MHHDIEVYQQSEIAEASAEKLAQWARSAVAERGIFTVAVSGGRTPWAMLSTLVTLDVPWANTTIFQVDERIAPADDGVRNLVGLRNALGSTKATLVPMPVERTDLAAAAADYARLIPDHIDVIHLGLGPDGHTASLVPDDEVLTVTDQPIAVTSYVYQGHQRMTMTFPTLARARQLLWLVTGADKAAALKQLVDGDTSIPAARVAAPRSLIMADRLAAADI